MKMFLCPDCNEHKPRRRFSDKTGRRQEVCTDCRRRARQLEYYHKNKTKRVTAATQAKTTAALAKQRQMMAQSHHAQLLRVLSRKASAHKTALKKHLTKIKLGLAGSRTDEAAKSNANKLAYYRELIALVTAHAKTGTEYPLDYYLGNTYLLNKHGFVCTIEHSDPWTD